MTPVKVIPERVSIIYFVKNDGNLSLRINFIFGLCFLHKKRKEEILISEKEHRYVKFNNVKL